MSALRHTSQSYSIGVFGGQRLAAMVTMVVSTLLQFRQSCPSATHKLTDLAAIVDIYNDAIPGRLATADTEPVTVAQRMAWFADFDPARRPIWVSLPDGRRPGRGLAVAALVLRAARPTPTPSKWPSTWRRRRSAAASRARCSTMRWRRRPASTSRRCSRSFSVTTRRRSRCSSVRAFAPWGALPRVAVLDGVERDLAILGRRVA